MKSVKVFFLIQLTIYAGMRVKSLQLCLTLCDPMDCSPPGSSVHGILQARVLEWIAISFSREYSWLRIKLGSPVSRGILYPLTHRRSPDNIYRLILCRHNFLLAYKHIMCTCVFACVCVCVCVSMCVHPHMCLSVCKPLYGVVMEEKCVFWENETFLSITFGEFFLSYSLMNIVTVLRTPMSVIMATSVSRKYIYIFKRCILFMSSYNSRFLHVHLALSMTCFVFAVNFGTTAQF